MEFRHHVADARQQALVTVDRLAAQRGDRLRLAPRLAQIRRGRPVDRAEVVRARNRLQRHQGHRSSVRTRQHARSRMEPRRATAVPVPPQRVFSDRCDQRLAVSNRPRSRVAAQQCGGGNHRKKSASIHGSDPFLSIPGVWLAVGVRHVIVASFLTTCGRVERIFRSPAFPKKLPMARYSLIRPEAIFGAAGRKCQRQR